MANSKRKQKSMLAPHEVHFFQAQPKEAQIKVIYVDFRVTFEKQSLLRSEKVENTRFKSVFGSKNGNFTVKKNVLAPLEVKKFLVLPNPISWRRR